MGAAKAAGDWQLGPTVYEVCSFSLEDSSVTSVTVQTAFLGYRSIPYRRLGDAVHDIADVPDGGTVHRGSRDIAGPTARLCGLPKRDGIGPDQLQRTDREK
jgi:hypothetical protein